ncbi:MAG: C-GCAxxG-C-C family protein [Anaerolineae bacterium]
MLLAVGEHKLGRLAPQAQRMATPLAGGLGCTYLEVCGALVGGVMVIGGLLGRTDTAEDDEQAQALAARFRTRFLAELGHTQCQAIRDRVHAPGGPGTCAFVVEQAAHILLVLLEEEGL